MTSRFTHKILYFLLIICLSVGLNTSSGFTMGGDVVDPTQKEVVPEQDLDGQTSNTLKKAPVGKAPQTHVDQSDYRARLQDLIQEQLKGNKATETPEDSKTTKAEEKKEEETAKNIRDHILDIARNNEDRADYIGKQIAAILSGYDHLPDPIPCGNGAEISGISNQVKTAFLDSFVEKADTLKTGAANAMKQASNATAFYGFISGELLNLQNAALNSTIEKECAQAPIPVADADKDKKDEEEKKDEEQVADSAAVGGQSYPPGTHPEEADTHDNYGTGPASQHKHSPNVGKVSLGPVQDSNVIYQDKQSFPDTKGTVYLAFRSTHNPYAAHCVLSVDGKVRQDCKKGLDKVLATRGKTVNNTPMNANLYYNVWVACKAANSLVCKMGNTKTHAVSSSGLRPASLNAALAKKSKNVAKKSQHIVAAASDTRFPDVTPNELYKWCRLKVNGGCGRGKTFTHIDAGRKRCWLYSPIRGVPCTKSFL